MIILPPQPYLPGRTDRPGPEWFAPQRGPGAFAAGFEAFERGYFWEAHELWEPVWMAQPPASAERALLRGLIQLANAGLKRRMGRDAAAVRILALADAALSEALARGPVLGVTHEKAIALRDICNKMQVSIPTSDQDVHYSPPKA